MLNGAAQVNGATMAANRIVSAEPAKAIHILIKKEFYVLFRYHWKFLLRQQMDKFVVNGAIGANDFFFKDGIGRV